MEKIQNIQANSPSFKANAVLPAKLTADNKEKNIQDGDKKSMDTLKWAGIIAAGALAVGGAVYAIRKGQTVNVSELEDKGLKIAKDTISKNGEKWSGTVVSENGLKRIYKDGNLVKAIKEGENGFVSIFNRNSEGILEGVEKKFNKGDVIYKYGLDEATKKLKWTHIGEKALTEADKLAEKAGIAKSVSENWSKKYEDLSKKVEELAKDTSEEGKKALEEAKELLSKAESKTNKSSEAYLRFLNEAEAAKAAQPAAEAVAEKTAEAAEKVADKAAEAAQKAPEEAAQTATQVEKSLLDKTVDELKKERKSLNDKISRQTKKLEAATGEARKTIQEKIDALTEELKKVKDRIAELTSKK